ncbi:MAG: Rrf2 family transcriptional regulator [Spirochaetaceae bacterium]|jgi:DNA-binding IscR family transcriptional regulator|nr:Rrf2 family transcriptional regulator [Spirochaetaceae bacterium]
MQIGTQFSIALHILLSVEFFKGKQKLTSDFLASSAGVNPVIIRNIMSLLRNAGIIDVTQGIAGIQLKRKPGKISLLDVYLAIHPVKNGHLFKIHEGTEQSCPVGSHIHDLFSPYFMKAQNAMENTLGKFSLQTLLHDLDQMQPNAKNLGSLSTEKTQETHTRVVPLDYEDVGLVAVN